MNSFTKGLMSLVIVLMSVLLIEGCAVSPRTSSWVVPTRLTYKQVVDAAIRAGSEQGMSLGTINPETGNVSFTQHIADVVVVLSVSVQKMPSNKIQVQTTVTTSQVAVMGIHEEFIDKFHAGLFRNLGVTKESESNVTIKIL